MRCKTVTVDVDVYVDDIIDDLDDEELVEELERRGYTCVKDSKHHSDGFNNEDWNLLLNLIDSVKDNWENRRVREKILFMRYG